MTPKHHPTLHVVRLEDRLTPVNLDAAFGIGGSLDRIPTGTQIGALSVNPATFFPDGSTIQASERVNYSFSTDTASYGIELARLKPDGRLDPSFGTGGFVTTPLPLSFPGVSTSVYGVRPRALSDGTTYVPLLIERRGVETAEGYVARFRPDGSLDPSYGTDGLARLPDLGALTQFNASTYEGDTYLLQPDGGVVAVAARRGQTVTIARLLPTGESDPAFGLRRLDPEPGNDLTLRDVRLAPDGKIVVGGTLRRPSTNPGSLSGLTSVVIRLRADGSFDDSFGSQGVARLPQLLRNADQDALVERIAPLADGGVAMVGRAVLLSDAGNPTERLVVFSRLDSRGVPDARFDGDGQLILRLDVNTTFGIQTLEVLPDGRALAAGSQAVTNTPGQLIKLTQVTADGRLDRSFGINGTAVLNPLQTSVASYDITHARLTQDGRVITLLRHTGNSPYDSLAAFDLDAQTPPGAAGVGLTEFDPPADDLLPFEGAHQTTSADLTGDGRRDVITYGRVGNQPRVRVTDGATSQVIIDELVFEPTFLGGIFTVTADLDGDGRDELIVSPDVGGGARVQVFSAGGGRLVQRDNFFAIEDTAFRGGGRIAAGDLDGDGVPDLLVGAGVGGGPRVAAYRGQGLLRQSPSPEKLIPDFFAFPGSDAVTLRDGVFLSAGDFTGDRKAEVVFGGGPGGAARVFALDGALIAAGRVAVAQAAPLANFFVRGNTTSRGGVKVAVADFDADDRPELAVHAPGFAPAESVRVYPAAAVLGSGGREPASDDSPALLGAAAALFGVSVG